MRSAYRPASLILGLSSAEGGLVALVHRGRLLKVGPGATAEELRALCAQAGVAREEIGQLALSIGVGALRARLARRRAQSWGRRTLGLEAAFVRAGRMGTAPLGRIDTAPLGRIDTASLGDPDRRDRVSSHERVRCLAAAAAYTVPWRQGLVAVGLPAGDPSPGLHLFQATSGKLVQLGREPLDPQDPLPALRAACRRLRQPRLALAGPALLGSALRLALESSPELDAVWSLPLSPPGAAAAGAALLAWADERQGAWIPEEPAPGLLETD